MSQRGVSSKNKGRFAAEVPTTNLVEDDDFPEFEAFDDATPRSQPPGGLSVDTVDMCQALNKPLHRTTAYDIEQLVVRRGQEFVMKVTFNRPVTPEDDYHVEFRIGSNPSASKGSLITVVFGPNSCSTNSRQSSCSTWSGRILETVGNSVTVAIVPRADAIVGKFHTYVAVGAGLQYTNRDSATDLYVLFNAWCPEDHVYVTNENECYEYVLNDIGIMYQGTVGSVSHRSWMYGQFERGILDACIYILDMSRMPITDRGNVTKVIRKGSAMINAQDDNGVLVGNWSDDYSMGTAPTAWTGSTSILLKYVNSGVPVCYAQCWVFAGVFNTFLRCLGIPARVITNFSSAHDNTGNLKTDLIFKMDGTPDRRNTRDSIWNYHCWNEVFMYRQDLPSKFSGWQVVDATPQETSDGYYRCGPSSVAAIKDGEVSYPYDSGFVFAEVNSDVVCYKRDRYGNLTPFRVDTTLVGQAIYTKGIGSNAPMEITYNYKYHQDSPGDKKAMALAESFGLARDQSEVTEVPLDVTIYAKETAMCKEVDLMVEFHNKGDVPKTVVAQMTAAVINYTGYPGPDFKKESIEVTVPAHQTQRVMTKTTAEEYMPHLISQPFLYYIVSGQAEGDIVSATKVVTLLTPIISITLHSQPRLGQQTLVTVSFTNTLSCHLENVTLILDGPGVMSVRARYYSNIAPQASISWNDMFEPRLAGPRALVAVLDSKKLTQVWGYTEFTVLP